MTLLINIGTAFSVFILSVIILSTNYKTIWPAPNFITHSATFDFVFADIAKHSFVANPIDIEYAYKSSPIATISYQLVNHSDELQRHQSILERQSNLHHLLHIPPWALVPDRIASASGNVDDLSQIFQSLSNKQKTTLAVLSDLIEVIPTESILEAHMQRLNAAQKYWIKNMTQELFNASQTIFAYQFTNYAEEITQWVQNSENSNEYLRMLFERTRGWPLLYNPSITQQLSHLDHHYRSLCQQILDSSSASRDNDVMGMEQCVLFLDGILPWMPDKSPTLSTMWPTYYDVDVDALKRIHGINSPYTLVVKQKRKPSGELLHYVSAKGDERHQVEWFNEEHHLRATNLAFVRRIRIQIKRIASILKNSVTLSSEMEHEDEMAAFWASLEAEEEDGPRPSDRHIEQLPDLFKDYVKTYAQELEKGQFDKILDMDLSQNDDDKNNEIFIHGLPSMAVFNDGGIKRAWCFILGVIDTELIPHKRALQNTQQQTALDQIDLASIQSAIKRALQQTQQQTALDQIDLASIQSAHHAAHNIELEIVGVWPYAVAGYLRTITPEVATYTYPPFADAQKTYGKQRSVILLDVMDKLYVNNMRQIGIQRLHDNDDAKLITLQSTLKYRTNWLALQHRYFHNRDEYGVQHTLPQALFIRVMAWIGCLEEDGDGEEKVATTQSQYGCLLSGVMYHVLEGFNRDDRSSLLFLAMLEEESLLTWHKKEDNGKDVMRIVNVSQLQEKLQTTPKIWNEWQRKYFNGNVEHAVNELLDVWMKDTDKMKIYKRCIRHVSKYSVVRRPGEDTFALSA
eukprot:CAMPEP_0202730196 /NCGR_PEP_ID=MMETSP1385-20130828/186516_1 /ASSEMBLY_ACC=CAM_ASM_000861 /TAXON_ID=933848 /ORGANISM="Elphidium margaritaceum" /LENGTH=798 /DNA_ID=CAMNT_0049396469 /DNA_START=20 /DNA_END=2417 /DNA_ORIENTATION=+